MMNHHTIPKLGFGPYKSSTSGVGSFFLPKILTHPTDRSCAGGKVALELTHGNSKQVITLPSEKLDSNKRYYVTFTLNPDSTTDGDPPLSTGEPHAGQQQQQQQQQPPPSATDAQDNAQPQRRQQQQQQQHHHQRSPSVGPQSQSRALPTVEEQRSETSPGGTPA
uniref:Uncharacterized protein n=1 Tax=Anopheles maculatus TaxID=74869 RepID=A0A182T4I5_9DIPT